MSQATWLLAEFKKRGSIFNYELPNEYHLLQYNARIKDIRDEYGEDIITKEPDPQGRKGVNLYVYHPKQLEQETLIHVEPVKARYRYEG
jgi:hypothetical protein